MHAAFVDVLIGGGAFGLADLVAQLVEVWDAPHHINAVRVVDKDKKEQAAVNSPTRFKSQHKTNAQFEQKDIDLYKEDFMKEYYRVEITQRFSIRRGVTLTVAGCVYGFVFHYWVVLLDWIATDVEPAEPGGEPASNTLQAVQKTLIDFVGNGSLQHGVVLGAVLALAKYPLFKWISSQWQPAALAGLEALLYAMAPIVTKGEYTRGKFGRLFDQIDRKVVATDEEWQDLGETPEAPVVGP